MSLPDDVWERFVQDSERDIRVSAPKEPSARWRETPLGQEAGGPAARPARGMAYRPGPAGHERTYHPAPPGLERPGLSGEATDPYDRSRELASAGGDGGACGVVTRV